MICVSVCQCVCVCVPASVIDNLWARHGCWNRTDPTEVRCLPREARTRVVGYSLYVEKRGTYTWFLVFDFALHTHVGRDVFY